MKKSIITILAAVAMLGAMTGCADLTKKGGDINEDAKNWKFPSTKADDTLGTKAEVRVELETYNVNWSCVTDKTGRVRPETGKKKTIEDKEYLVFTFDSVTGKSEENVLYIGMSNWDGKLSDNQTTDDVDFRGAVTIKPGCYTTIKAKNFSEYIKTVAALKITNDEPYNTASTKSVWPEGDYTITEIWPLEAKDANKDVKGEKYRVRAAMKYQDLKVEKGSSITVLVPAKEVYLGVYQPNRNKKADGSAAACKYAKWEDVPPTVGEEWEVSNLDDYLDANIHSMFAKKMDLERHSTNNTITSYGITGNRFNYKDKTDIIRTKTADGEEIIEEIYELEEGSFEK